MKIELHILQNFAPSNLNRDDTGAPKDCEFGGYRRARISSQCFKRAVREAFRAHRLLGSETDAKLGVRTKRLVDAAASALEKKGRDPGAAKRIVGFALAGAELKTAEENKTQYLLFVPRRTIDRIVEIVDEHWSVLEGAVPPPVEPAAEGDAKAKKGAAKGKKADKAAAKSAVPKEVAAKMSDVLRDATHTPDLALFGRMIADAPEWNVDAACQVAHAMSTNRVSMEFDFFTAVDDLKPKDTAGSDMMGTIAFNSSCFYRYACLDVDSLRENLGPVDASDTTALTKQTVEAFLRASALAIPTGKQNGMAAHNLPSYVLVTVRKDGAPMSLANAFLEPVRPTGQRDLVRGSIDALEGYLGRSTAMWGNAGTEHIACADVQLEPHEGVARSASFEALVDTVLQRIGAQA